MKLQKKWKFVDISKPWVTFLVVSDPLVKGDAITKMMREYNGSIADPEPEIIVSSGSTGA